MPKKILNNALGLIGLVVFTAVLIAFFSAQTQSAVTDSATVTLLSGLTPSASRSAQTILLSANATFTSTAHIAQGDYEMQRLTTSGDVYQPAVSLDGRQVLYASVREGNWDLYLIDLTNLVEAKRLAGDSYNQLDLATIAKTQRLTNDSYNDMSPVWAPPRTDGTWIAYQRYASTATGAEAVEWVESELSYGDWDRRVVARGVQRLENGLPAWSPSGDRLAFTDGSELVVASVNERRELRRFDLVKRQPYSQPVWFDNDRILFISQGVLQVGDVATGVSQPVPGPSSFVSQVMVRNSTIVYIQEAGASAQAIAQNLDGTNASTMVTIPLDAGAQPGLVKSAALAPHGQAIAFRTDLGLYVTYVSTEQPFTFKIPADVLATDRWEISWLPDNSGFVCVAAPDGQPDLYLVQPVPASLRSGATGAFELGGHVDNFRHPDLMQQAGMSWLKVQTSIDSNGVGIVNMAHRAGFKVLLGVLGDKSRITDPVYQDQYAQAVAALAAAGADAIEVWNEPNLEREWPVGQINGAAYTQLLAKAYNAIKTASPGTLVISAGLAPTGLFADGCQSGGCNDEVFLQQMVAAGAANYLDCVGTHYNAGATAPTASAGHPANNDHHSWYFQPTLNLYYDAFGGARPVCFTEFGYLTAEGFPTLASTAPTFAWAEKVTLAQQAQWLAEAVALSIESNTVRLMIIWNVDFINYDSDPMGGYAIIRPNDSCPACDSLGSVMRPR